MKTKCKFSIRKIFKSYFSEKKTGRRLSVPVMALFRAMLYKLKTGVQWYLLPTEKFFKKRKISYQTVFYHYNCWCKSGLFQKTQEALLVSNKKRIKTFVLNLDGTHTPAKKGGKAVGYQGRKKCRTTNLLIITNENGCPLVCSPALSGNRHDLFEIEKNAPKMLSSLRRILGDFNNTILNADAGFDTEKLRKICQDFGIVPNIEQNKRNNKSQEMRQIVDNKAYKKRFSVEQANAWLDSYRTLSVRYCTSDVNWVQTHYLAFSLIFLKKIFRFKECF